MTPRCVSPAVDVSAVYDVEGGFARNADGSVARIRRCLGCGATFSTLGRGPYYDDSRDIRHHDPFECLAELSGRLRQAEKWIAEQKAERAREEAAEEAVARTCPHCGCDPCEGIS